MKKNIPYVKHFDEKGVLLNPINGEYKSDAPNRSQRRSKPQRFHGNNKGVSLVVKGTMAFYKVIQLVVDKDFTVKRIEHYVQKASV